MSKAKVRPASRFNPDDPLDSAIERLYAAKLRRKHGDSILLDLELVRRDLDRAEHDENEYDGPGGSEEDS